MTLDQWLAERERQEREATPGPWKVDPVSPKYIQDPRGHIIVRAEEGDVPLVVALRNDGPHVRALVQAAAPIITWVALDTVDRVEQLAAAFYAETGFMAPGKDVPAAMGGQDPRERRQAYYQWHDALMFWWEVRASEAAAALRALLEAAC